MTVSLKHTFVSPKADGPDTTLVQPSSWNAEHTITLAAGKVLGRDSSAAGAVQELPLSFDPTGQAMVPPVGTTAQRPVTPVTGMLRYNTTIGKFEQYNGTSWGSIGGGATISDSAPSNPQPGDLWWKSDEGQMYVYYNDGTSNQWVVANAFQGGTAFGNITVTSINSGPLAGSRNRIINGAMEIDQRNAGAAVANANAYIVDRWGDFRAGTGSYTAQRSTVAPPGFAYSFQHTISNAVTPAASDVYQILQNIEGLNTVDLAFGTTSAKTVTLSFWVRSSVAGLYAAYFTNAGQSRSLVQTYAISAANTWEYKTITIPGDTTGTWAIDNTTGLTVGFDLGSGSNANTATLGAWQGSLARRTSSCVNLISTNGATFYLTGVQLEVGSQATPFERRNYQQELAMCQRYWERCYSFFQNDVNTANPFNMGGSSSYASEKRASPTLAIVADASGNVSSNNVSASPVPTRAFYVSGQGTSGYVSRYISVTVTANAEL